MVLELPSETLRSLAGAPTSLSPQGSAVSDFLREDDGHSLLDWAEPSSSFSDRMTPTPSTVTLWRTPTFTSIKSARTTQTEDSVVPHLQNNGVIIPLASLCELIGRCASLECAQILSVECYKRWSNFGVLHRYLIFHLRRPGRHDVWLRLDRRPTKNMAFQKLLLGVGRTQANDTALLAATKSELVDDATKGPENLLTFATPPNLGAFRFILTIITEELLEYKVWPANCWFLCSLLQELLAEASGGVFAIGRATHPDLARDVRARVFDRVFHVPSGSSIPSLLRLIILKRRDGATGKGGQTLVSALKQANELEPSFLSQKLDVDIAGKIDALTDTFNSLLKFLDQTTACQVASRGVALTRRLYLYSHGSDTFRSKHIATLNTYTSQLFAAGRLVEACAVAQETLEVFEVLLQSTPSLPKGHRKISTSSDPGSRNVSDSTSDADGEYRGRLNFVVGMFRFLYNRDPETYYLQFAKALDIYSRYLFRAKLQKTAHDTELEIVAVYRDMHAREPEKYYEQFNDRLEAYERRLAAFSFLKQDDGEIPHNQGGAGSLSLASDMDDWSARLAARLERVDMFRALYRLNRNRYHRDLQDALHAYAELLAQSGKRGTWEAGEALSAATRIDRRHPPVWDARDADDRIERLYEGARTLRTLASHISV